MFSYTRTASMIAAVWLTVSVARAAEIHDAAKNGRLEAVRDLLSKGVDPDSRDGDGRTPLRYAAEAGHLEVVKALLDHKADINLADPGGNTPLFMALIRNHPAVARFLIERDADVRTITTHQRITVLHAGCAGAFRQDPELIKLLVAKGADVNVRGRRGEAALHWAAGGGVLVAMRLLIESGADLNPYDSAYGTPLHEALQQNRQEAARLLIDNGARLTEKDPYGYTALHLAALRGYADLAKVLLQRGADPQAGDRYGRTALHLAARHGYRAVADALVAAGAKQGGVTERNFGKPPQLGASLAGGEAYLWFLGFFAHDGYAVKTSRHLLLFDPPGIDESSEAGLANGRLNPKELEGQNIIVFITKPSWERFEPAVFDLVNRVKSVDIVMAYKPEGRAGGHTIPPYRLAEPGQTLSIGGVTVHPIRATLGGAAYLVEADGLKVFHAGYHVRNTPAQDEGYRREIDSLGTAAPIDIALLPTAGHTIEPYTYEAYLYLLNRLAPRAVYLMHGGYGRENYWECATILQSAGAHVEFPENEGDRFHFVPGHSPQLPNSGSKD
jgi:ankyrin repeat protein